MVAAFFHHLRVLWEATSQAPMDWPFIFFLPVLAGVFVASREQYRARLAPVAKPLVLLGSALTLAAGFYIAIHYLSTNFIINSVATLYAITSWFFSIGQPAYSGLHAHEPYSLPYGPFGYMVTGWFDRALGPSVFASKLPSLLATFASWLFLYLALRTRVAWLPAFALTALASALPLPFEPIQFWTRPDIFLLLSVSGALWASTRRGIGGPIFFGIFLGLAINLKFYAFAFFSVPLVLALRNDKPVGLWILGGAAAALTALVPFAWPNVSFTDYLLVLKMHAAMAKFIDGLALQYLEWLALFCLVGFSPLIIYKLNTEEILAALRKNSVLLGSLPLAFFIVGYPASDEGAGPHHLIPFIPVMVYLAAHLDADIHFKPFLQRAYNWPGLSVILSLVLFAEFNALYLGITESHRLAGRETLAKDRIADIGQILHDKMPCVLLNASGSMATLEDDFYRTTLVFNGMPIGPDPTATMDYIYLAGREPDLPAFVAGLKAKYNNEPIYWICPRNVTPFSLTSYYALGPRVYPDKFVNDFNGRFELSGHSACFDIYAEKSNAVSSNPESPTH